MGSISEQFVMYTAVLNIYFRFIPWFIFEHTVEPPCAITSRKRPPIQNTKIFLVKAFDLEPLVNDHLL